MKLYNTLSRCKEELQPLEPGHFKIYSCGPTVYRYIHIGNLRTFTMVDWIRRALLQHGFKVTHVKNITDVGHMRVEMLDQGEDKLIAQARKEGKTSAEIATFYTEAFMTDEHKLNILPADVFPRATQHIPQMLEIVAGLVNKGVAYEVEGDVFFDIKRFKGYGKLSGNLLEGLVQGARDTTDVRRRNPEDFPLWKKAEPNREMAWDSQWGRGFPGWHIECSAMSMHYLGRHFDIHTGGVDNIFPHHEDELAQSEAFTGETFANYWIHAQHLLADGLKMAKSTGNAYTLAEVEALGFEPLSLRYFYTTALYRSRINFTFTALRAAQTSLHRLQLTALRLAAHLNLANVYEPSAGPATRWQQAFENAVYDDLNMPKAMAILWQMIRTPADDLEDADKLALLLKWDEILGFGLRDYIQNAKTQEPLNPSTYFAQFEPAVAALVNERSGLRRAQAYQAADALRDKLKAMGYNVRDTLAGPLIVPRRPDEDFRAISTSNAGPDNRTAPDSYEFSVNLLSLNSRSDLQRCVESVQRHRNGRKLELVVIDNGSTDDTLDYLRGLAKARRNGELEPGLGLQVIFADHNLGFAAGRNATIRASRGHFVVLLDTSIEVNGDIWQALATTLNDPTVGVAGPYGLVTTDLREFAEAAGPEVDAIEGYLLAFRRELWSQVGPLDEKFRFYRLLDIYFSFFFKAGGFRAVNTPQVAERVIKHQHREWYSLSEEEQRTKSKKNYDLFRARWHHAQSLLVANYKPAARGFGHDNQYHIAGNHSHSLSELPPSGVPHTHKHQHWADHDHDHLHYHHSATENIIQPERVATGAARREQK